MFAVRKDRAYCSSNSKLKDRDQTEQDQRNKPTEVMKVKNFWCALCKDVLFELMYPSKLGLTNLLRVYQLESIRGSVDMVIIKL